MVSRYKCLNIAVCFLFFMQSNAEPSRRDLSSLINVLSQKYSGNRQPLLVILDSGSIGNNDKAQIYRAGFTESSDEDEAANIRHLLLQKPKVKHLLPVKKSTTRSLLQLKNEGQLHKLKRLQENRDRSLNDKNVLRSPIIKQLLRISNRIQCNAKDDCEDKCNNKYKGNTKIKCNLQCEVKYDCDEEENDPCDGDECGGDSCGNSAECLMSTRGVRLVTEETKCKRC